MSPNWKVPASKPEIIARKTYLPPQQSSFSIPQELVTGSLPPYDPRNIYLSSDELLSRFLGDRLEKSNAIDQAIQPRADSHSHPGERTQLFPLERAHHEFSFCSTLNCGSQSRSASCFQKPSGNVKNSNWMTNAQSDITFSDLKVGEANNPDSSIMFAQSPKRLSGMTGLADSITFGDDPTQFERCQFQPTSHKHTSVNNGCHDPSAPSNQASPDVSHAASFGMISSDLPLATGIAQERLINEKELEYTGFEPSPRETFDSEDTSVGRLIREKTRTPPCSSSISSNPSSQYSTPSFSSTSSHSRSSSYAPSQPTHWNDFSENSLVFQSFNEPVFTDSGNQNLCPQFSTDNINTSCFNVTGNDPLEFLSYPLQCYLQQKPLPEHLQQLRPNDRFQPVLNIPQLLIDDYSIEHSGKNRTSQDSRVPLFICPRCGKGHTRQSNLLAHLRDTHSKVKKVFCDVPGCTKSYKRVSECRRHKKDVHKIPLPSELSGKVRKPRSAMSSVFRKSKSRNVITSHNLYE